MFDDDKFDRTFDRHFNRMEKALDHPGRTIAMVVAANILIWSVLALIVAVIVKVVFF